MALNFDAQVRMTEALLPLLRASAPSAIVNVASTAGRVARGGAGAYSASKAALAVWSDALRAEEHAYGVHVGSVMPGFIPTEGFPQRELAEKRTTRWLLGTEEQAADAIAEAGLDGRAERYVPRGYALLAALRTLTPGVVRRVLASKRADVLATTTSPQKGEARSTSGPQEGVARSTGNPQEGVAQAPDGEARSTGYPKEGEAQSRPDMDVRHANQTRSG